MTKNELLNKLAEEKNKNDVLRKENELLVQELLELSQGWGVRPYFMKEHDNWDIAMKNKAAIAVKSHVARRQK